MSLPPLPDPSGKQWDDDSDEWMRAFTDLQMCEYGELCRKMALEEAAKEVDHIMFFNGKTFGEKIRELK